VVINKERHRESRAN